MKESPQSQESASSVDPTPHVGEQQRTGSPVVQRPPKSRSCWLPPPSREEIVMAVLVLVFLIGFPWLNPGYRFLSLAITTGFTAIALYGLGLQFGQAGIMSVGH